MYHPIRSTVFSLACFMAFSSQGFMPSVSASEANSVVAARGGGGGGGGMHGGGHSDYHPAESHPNAARHDAVNHAENRDYNGGIYNHPGGEYNHNEFNRDVNAFDRNAAAGWEAGALDAVPAGEYVYPGAAVPTTSGDMDTLYDYDNANNSTNPSVPQ